MSSTPAPMPARLQQDLPVGADPHAPSGYMRDAQGRLVPERNVKPEHLLEDALVRELHGKAALVTATLEALKAEAFGEIETLLAMLAEKHGAARGGEKGNLTLASYDGSLRIQVAVGDLLSFGPELQVAKTLIDSCIKRWSKGGDPNLQAIVNDAFDVGKEGKLRVDRILGLKRLAIDDVEWARAMGAISDAIRVTQSRRYVRFYRRASPEKPYEQVPLDIARVAG